MILLQTNDNIEISSYIKFANKVNGSSWNKGIVARKFSAEVDKEDYSRKDRDDILNYLYSLAQRTSK